MGVEPVLKPRVETLPELGERARALLRTGLVWDNTLPWTMTGNAVDIDEILPRYHAAGINFVSLTVDFRVPIERTIASIASTGRQVRERSEYLTLAASTERIHQAKRDGRLAVGLNLQDTLPYGNNLDSVQLLADLGVKQAVLAYNNRNFVGDGCAEPADAGLSLFGRRLIAELDRVGVIVDGSHAGRRTTLEAMEIGERPFVFSHAIPFAMRPHYRNITDEQILACAATGGVVGINGVGYWIGDNDAPTERIFACLDYAVNLVGAEHVGLGFDYIHDIDAIIRWVHADPIAWPPYEGEQMPKHNFAGPEQLVELVQVMVDHGYPDAAITGILGANFERVANAVWT